MYSKQSHKQYAANQVCTADRGKILVMLYDGCLSFLKQSKEGLEQKNIAKFSKYLSKAQAIVTELIVTLDFEKGGKIAEELERIYDFVLFHLTEANIQKDPVKIQNAIDLIEKIASAYREIVKSGKANQENSGNVKETPEKKAIVKPGQSFSALL